VGGSEFFFFFNKRTFVKIRRCDATGQDKPAYVDYLFTSTNPVLNSIFNVQNTEPINSAITSCYC